MQSEEEDDQERMLRHRRVETRKPLKSPRKRFREGEMEEEWRDQQVTIKTFLFLRHVLRLSVGVRPTVVPDGGLNGATVPLSILSN